ncbi:MAG: type II toxin-antitoxin system death-on-curing family toxin [Isosphaeraceae bacterium]|nr:type II toxin-antitoxin system death-on-curing family toxin [Isosphaeraceae bacterium]
MKYLSLDLILRIHERVIAATGGDPAVLDIGRLDSAVAQPRMGFGGQSLYPTLAALAFSLSMNHPFADGNKRTSDVAMRTFLSRNGHDIDPAVSVDEREAVFLGVVAGAVTREQFTGWVRAHVVRRGR